VKYVPVLELSTNKWITRLPGYIASIAMQQHDRAGSIQARALPGRPRGTMNLLDRLEQDDVLIVTQMDRLGRKHDCRLQYGRTAWRKKLGVRVLCLALGWVDLTSPAGRMTMTMISAVARRFVSG
jgi:DNA invertase Pin-like site-specific DNA recombinase